MPEMERNRSMSISSKPMWKPNSSSSLSSSAANSRESMLRLSNRSVSSAGVGSPSAFSNKSSTLCRRGRFSGIGAAPVVIGLQLEQQPVERPAVDVVAIALPADGREVEFLEYAQRRMVAFHRPGVDALQSVFGEAERKHRGGGAEHITLGCVAP